MARSPLAKDISTRLFTWVCPTPSSSYSMGSSTVRILRWGEFSSARIAYSVVLFPDPVGPVTRMMPCGCCTKPFSRRLSTADSPIFSSVRRRLFLSSRRSTALSPYCEGNVETRTSIFLRPRRREIRPSCGSRFSAISSRAMTLIREISSGASFLAG